jgi:hypothetical protein
MKKSVFIFALMSITLLSCVTKKNYTNDIETQIILQITLPGEESHTDYSNFEADTNLYNTYNVKYKNGYTQTISISANSELKDFLTYEVLEIDTIQKEVLWEELY